MSTLLPETFPMGTLFAVVDGVPVTESPDGEITGWDAAQPRHIHLADLSSSVPVSEETFRAMVRAYQSIAA